MADAPDDAAAAAKKKKKKMMIGGLVAAGLAYQFVLKKPPPPEDAAAAAEEAVIEEGEVATLPEELVVNLADQNEVHYARVGVAVVLELGIAAADIEPELAKVSDVVIDVISTKTYAELRVPGATTALKEEISREARKAFDDERVMRVLFTTFVTQ